MKIHTIVREQLLPRPLAEVFAFYASAENLECITPPWLGFCILTPAPIRMEAGTRIDYRMRLRGMPVTWKTKITEWDPPHRFVDVQLHGPYRMWEHTHEFRAVTSGTLVRDEIRYAMPAGFLGELVRRAVVARDITRIFDHRRAVLETLFRS